MLKRVRELPDHRRPVRKSAVAGDVREFLRNTIYDVAEVTVEGKRGKNVAVMLADYIRKHPEQCAGIGSAYRDGRAYLYRKEAGR